MLKYPTSGHIFIKPLYFSTNSSLEAVVMSYSDFTMVKGEKQLKFYRLDHFFSIHTVSPS